jgi:hypothetical protein
MAESVKPGLDEARAILLGEGAELVVYLDDHRLS